MTTDQHRHRHHLPWARDGTCQHNPACFSAPPLSPLAPSLARGHCSALGPSLACPKHAAPRGPCFCFNPRSCCARDPRNPKVLLDDASKIEEARKKEIIWKLKGHALTLHSRFVEAPESRCPRHHHRAGQGGPNHGPFPFATHPHPRNNSVCLHARAPLSLSLHSTGMLAPRAAPTLNCWRWSRKWEAMRPRSRAL